MNTIRQKQNIYFSGVISRKLLPQELKQVKEIEKSYYAILDVSNRVDTAKFKQRFPGLHTGKREKGLLLHSGDNQKSPQYHVYKFSPNKPLNIISTDGNDVITCKFDSDSLQITTKDDLKNGNSIIEKILNVVEKEIALLKEYSDFYPQIKSQLPLSGGLKAHIIELINKLKAPTSGIKSEVDQLMGDYNSLNDKLNVKFKDVSFKLKEAYFGKNVQKQGKEMTFEHNGKLVFCPLRTNDDKIFRLWNFDTNNNLKYAIVANSDGSISIAKNSEKYQDIRPHNLESITGEAIEKLEIKEDLKVLSEKFGEFEKYIDEYSSKYKLRKGNVETKTFAEIEQKKLEIAEQRAQQKAQKEATRRSLSQWREELQERRAQKEQLKLEKRKQKEIEKLEKEKAKAEKNKILAEKKAERQEKARLKKLEKEQTRLKKIEKEQKQIIKQEKNISTTPTDPKIFVAKGLEGVTLYRLAKKIDEVFAKPIEERGAHILHEKLPDGRIFTGKISTIAEDGSRITISRVKSPKYVDFTYYSIKLEQGGISAYLNIESDGGEIILSTVLGKPILDDGNRVRHISKAQCVKITPMTNEIPQYLKLLLNAE